MPIIASDPPKAALSLLKDEITHRCAHGSFATSCLDETDEAEIGYALPHQIAYLALDEIQRGAKLHDATTLSGWRFLIYDGDKVVAAARVLADGMDEYRLADLTEGPFVTGTEDAIRRAEELPGVRNGRFEPILLMAPDLHVVALWLHSGADDDADLVIPIAPTISRLTANEPLASGKFMEIAYELAQATRLRKATRR